MSSNYPPGVTGNEYAIAGPDSETEAADFLCPQCGSEAGTLLRFRAQAWVSCDACTWSEDAPDQDDYDDGDADRRHDEARDDAADWS
jgi:predicted RNA-binding Zn-ribbon protein involved in translation (DUF1610 family)